MKGLLTIGIDYMFREHYLAFWMLFRVLQRSINIMIENLNKNLVNTKVEVNESEKLSVFTHQFKVPFKKCDNLDLISKHISYKTVLEEFSDILQQALIMRMDACVDMLSRNLFNIILSNEHRIVFKKNDGSIHSFNHVSFNIMEEAVKLLQEKEYDLLLKPHYEQMLKALYWVEKPSDRKNISFGDLISCLMEMFEFGCSR